jgi:osmoprotectant transport system ATP-binding protein
VVRVDADLRVLDQDAGWLLVTDADGRPLGWAAPDARGADGGLPGPGGLAPCGRLFAYGRESLRVALDCAVLAPSGFAVAVDEGGRVVGVASQEAIGAAIRSAHHAVARPAGAAR